LKRVVVLFTVCMLLYGCTQKTYYNSPPLNDPASAVEKNFVSRTHYVGLVVADFDNDGLLDIAEAKYPSGEIVMKMSGANPSLPSSIKTKGEVLALESADFNNDGKVDIIFCGGKKNPGIHLFLNGGNQWILKEKIADEKIYLKVKAGDFDNDGRMDIAGLLTNHKTKKVYTGGINIWLQKTNSPKLTLSGIKLDNPFQDFSLGDINGDGILDIATADFEPYGGIKVFLGDGKGGWKPSPYPPATNGNFLSVTVSDLNNDGHNDIIAGSFIHGIKIWLHNGHLGWKEYTTPTSTGSFWNIVNIDINNDGIKDIFAGSFDTQGLRVWLSSGNKWKKGPDYLPSFSTIYAFTSFDINKDSQIDLLAISHGQGIKLIPLSREIKKKYFLTREPSEGFNNHSAARKISFKTLETNGFSYNHFKFAKAGDEDETDSASELNRQAFIEIDGAPVYIVGPKDVLEITSWAGKIRTTTNVKVRNDGKISYYFLDDLPVESLTTHQIDDLITEQLKQYIKKPRIAVTVKEFLSKKITLMGDFNVTTGISLRHEQYLKGKTTLLEMIWSTGGVRPTADLLHVTLYRGNRIRTLDFSKALIEPVSENPVLLPGDRIFIPTNPFAGAGITKSKVYILGEFEEPQVFEFVGEVNIAEAITKAKRFNPLTSSRYVSVIRGDFANPKIIPVDRIRLFRQGDLGQNIRLQNGDIVYLPRDRIQLAQDFFTKLQNLANSLIFMGLLRDTYTTGGSFLRFNTGGNIGVGGLSPGDAFN
jgi:protein involved in polysaccharide export with SLBB domain